MIKQLGKYLITFYKVGYITHKNEKIHQYWNTFTLFIPKIHFKRNPYDENLGVVYANWELFLGYISIIRVREDV